MTHEKYSYPHGVISIHLRERNALMKRSHTNSKCCILLIRVPVIQCNFMFLDSQAMWVRNGTEKKTKTVLNDLSSKLKICLQTNMFWSNGDRSCILQLFLKATQSSVNCQTRYKCSPVLLKNFSLKGSDLYHSLNFNSPTKI